MPKNRKGDPLGFSNTQSVVKYQRNWSGENYLFSEKKSHNAEKLKGGTLWDFPTSILLQNSKKMKGEPFGENFFPKKKSRSAFGLARYDMLSGKTGEPFLVQFALVQFGAIIFCRTFKNYFGQFVWIEKEGKPL